MPAELALHVPRMASDDGVIDAAKAVLGDALLDTNEHVGEIMLTVRRDNVVDVLRALRDTPGLEYQQLMEIAAVDYPQRAERFDVNYCLLSLTRNRRIKVKVTTDEAAPIPSVTGLWPVAGWLEREVFDMYGVAFSDNPDLRRILTDYGFEGFPFRKDFPLTGHVELRYSEAEKRVIYEPVSLPQDFRTFDFLMPWEGPEYRLPGDEKATAEAAGAPSPAPAPNAPGNASPKAQVRTPKTTEVPAQTGAGKPADDKAAEQARKPRTKKVAEVASHAASKSKTTTDPKPKSGRRPRKDGGST
jgi:NADH-quinone oxidoreductase subunit C